MQLLVEGEDRSLSIIYRKSVIVENVNTSLAVGEKIKFLWPENARKQKQFSGVILAKHKDEEVLQGIKDKVVESWKLQKKGCSKLNKRDETTISKSKCESENQSKESMRRPKNKPVTLLEKEIMAELRKDDFFPETQDKSETQTNAWLLDLIDSTKLEIKTDLDNTKAKILTKLDFIRNSLASDSNFDMQRYLNVTDVEVTKQRQRRSFGMPLVIDDDNLDDNINFEEQNLTFEPIDSLEARAIKKEKVLNDKNQCIAGPSKITTKVDTIELSSDDDEAMYADVKIKKEASDNELPRNIDLKNKQNRRKSNVLYSSDEEMNDEIARKKYKLPNLEHHEDCSDNDQDKENRENVMNKSSEWTLRYNSKTDTVMELMKGSDIFVHTLDIKTIEDSCKTQTEMARALMRAVFTDEALGKCTLKGKKPTIPGKIAKPGLHKQGIEVILMYVQKFSKKMNWPAKDRQTILRSMSAKLFEMKD